MDITSILSCIGGIGLFLFGMTYMGDGLKKCAGSQMKIFLGKVTSNPFKGFLVGMVVTMAIQSSTATNVMVLSFINSGMMGLTECIPLMIGANLGTTVTAWLISMSSIDGAGLLLTLLKPTSFTPIICIVGYIMFKVSKSGKKDVGAILIGFAALMFGMNMMSKSMSGLSSVPGFMELFDALSNPLLGIIFGTAMAAIMQSSSASIGVVQALALAGGINFGSVIPIVMGINIGQVVPVMIASTGTSKNARRAAVIDLYLNIAGVVVFLPIYMILRETGNFPFDQVMASPVTIAICHTGYKLLTSLFELPAYKFFDKLGRITIKNEDKKAKKALLDVNFMSTPSLALALCRQKIGESIKASNDSFADTIKLMDEWNSDVAKSVHRTEELVDWYQDEIDVYLAQLSTRPLTKKESLELSYLMHVIANYENITDHIYHMVVALNRLWDDGNEFSQVGENEIKGISELTTRILKMSEDVFYNPDSKKAFKIISLEQKIVKSCEKARNQHMNRLISGECSVQQGSVFTDILLDFERIADHLSKQARSMLFDDYKDQGTGAKRFLSMLIEQDSQDEERLKRG